MATQSATVLSDCWTNTMVATMAPGPASSGVPSGTRATLTFPFPDGCGSSILPVSSSMAMSSRSSPPDACSAGSVMCM